MLIACPLTTELFERVATDVNMQEMGLANLRPYKDRGSMCWHAHRKGGERGGGGGVPFHAAYWHMCSIQLYFMQYPPPFHNLHKTTCSVHVYVLATLTFSLFQPTESKSHPMTYNTGYIIHVGTQENMYLQSLVCLLLDVAGTVTWSYIITLLQFHD